MATVQVLNNNEQRGGFTHKAVLTYADLTETTVDTAQTIELVTVELGSRVAEVSYLLDTDFTDASDAAFNSTAITIGDGSSTNRFVVSKELNGNGTEIQAWSTANDVNSVPYTYLAADTVDIVFNSMSGKALNDLDAGQITIFFNIVHMGQ